MASAHIKINGTGTRHNAQLREFVDTLLYIEPASLAYHLERGDFSNWVENELKDAGLSERIRALDVQSSGEDLRSELLRLFPFAEARS